MKGRRRTADDHDSRCLPNRTVRICVRGQREYAVFLMGNFGQQPVEEFCVDSGDALLVELDRLMREREAVEL